MVYRADRNFVSLGRSKGGGVLLAVKRNIISSEMKLPDILRYPEVDLICVKLHLSNRNYYLFNVYIPPDYNTETYKFISDYFAHLDFVDCSNCLILGDFNILSYYSLGSDSLSRNSKVCSLNWLLTTLDMNQYNLITNSSNKILDLVISGLVCRVRRASDPILREDTHHPALEIECNMEVLVSQPNMKRSIHSSFNFRKADLGGLYGELAGVDWSFLSSFRDPNDACDALYDVIYEILVKHVPLTNPRNEDYPPWFTGDIIRKLRKKRKLLLAYRKYGNADTYSSFSCLRAEVKAEIHRSYSQYLATTEVNIPNNPKQFYSYAASKNKTNAVLERMRYGGEEFGDPLDITNAFASFFKEEYLGSIMHLVEDDIVISGIGGYFPKSKNVEEFKTHLLNNENLLETRWPEGERGVTNLIGKIPTEYFDNSYFGIHRQQSTFMDPMQRLVLERTYEALIDAGVNPSEVKGRRIGCFMGSSVGENDNLFLESIVSGFGVTGHARAMMSNRVSYWLNLKGPSVAYDSNWIGGIEVIRLAYDAIRVGQCESVIVGTANLALNAEFQWLYNDMGLLSQDGSTKAFDEDASGYARSDGVVVLYIQRASHARRSYASIVNVATRFNGMREGTLLDIDVPSMVDFMREFYEEAGIDPKEVDFVETYGCALKETDKKELESLEQVYCKNRKTPLLIGSVKPNTGHSEASAALFSVVKVLIAMETQTIPATIQYTKPNPEIAPLVNGTIKVVDKNLTWDGTYAAVNGIGLDSYYGHLLLKANPKKKTAKADDLPRLAIASTRTEPGIQEILQTIKSKEDVDPEYFQLLQDLFAKPILGHLYRGYVLLGTEEPKQEAEYHEGSKRQIWFVYSGMGSQWPGMVGDLMKIPVFAEAVHKCAKVLEPKGIDLMHIISTDDKKIFDNILHSFVGIAAIQIGLTDVLHSIGIVPDGIIGHSVGELGCAYADGCMTAEQMILAAYSRGRASLEAKLIKGMMAAIGMGYQQIKDRCPPSIEVACHNGPDSSTISGPTEDMEKFVKELQDEGIFARLVNVANIAYHSRYIKPAAPTLLKYLKEVIPEPVARSSKWISTSNLEENWNTDLAKSSSPDYHTNNLLSSVLFEEGLKHIPKDSVLIEIAPHGLLQAILKRSLKPGCTNVPLTQRGSKSGIEFILTSIGKLYLAGLDMNISSLYPKLPYPVSKGTPCLANLAHWEHSEVWRTGIEDKLATLFGVKDCQVTLNSEEFRDCVGHQLDDKIIMPCSAYLMIAYDVISNITSGHKEMVFENLHFRKAITIPKIGGVALHAMIQKGSGEFEILAENEIVLTGKLTIPEANEKFMTNVSDIEVGEENVNLSGNDFYSELQHRGHKYSGPYKTVKNLTIGEEGSTGIIQWNNQWTYFLEGMIQQYILQAGEKNQDIHVPKTIQKIAISQNILPTEKKDLKVTYNRFTNIISTDGIQIIGLKSTPIPREKRPLSFDSMEFVPLNFSCPNIDSCINAAIQLTLDNFNDQFITNVMITEIEAENPPLIENVKNVLSQYKKLNPNITTATDAKMIIVQQNYPLLLVMNGLLKEDIVKIIASSHGFLLARSDRRISQYPHVVEVANLSLNGVSYSIIRKAASIKPEIVTVKGDTFSAKDITRGNVQWVTELEAAAAKHNTVYLVASTVPTEGIPNFVQELRSASNIPNLRVHFSLDKRVTSVNPSEPFYQRLIKQDLVLTVFKEGALGTYISVPVNFMEDVHNNMNITTNSIKNVTISYISVNQKDETVLPPGKKKPELGNIDYAGVNNKGEKVVGLAKYDYETFKLVPDDILTWIVPESWLPEDAISIPHAYASAYYCLMVKGKLKPGETVLIHAGHTAIGMAAISIASSYGCSVYTTVCTDWQKTFLKKTFTFLRDRNIMSCENSNFEPLLLMATGGEGAHVILNCLSGNLLQASVSCLAAYGRFIQIGKYDLQTDNFIGMNVFLKNTSFYVVDLNNIFDAPNDVKTEVRNLINQGMQAFTVRPIVRKVVEHQDIGEILRILESSTHTGKVLVKVSNMSLNKFNVDKPTQFICDPKSSYLVYGGTLEAWSDMVEWLVLRGARKIVVASESKPNQNHINRRLSLLQSFFNCDIILAPSKAHTREGAAELLSEVYFLGPIHGVFILSNKSNVSKNTEIKPVQYIDNALRTTAPKAIFVNFITSAAGICQLRSEAGFCTYNVSWHNDLDFGDCLNGLDDILSLKCKDVIIKNDKLSDTAQESNQALFKKLTLMLPATMDDSVQELKLAPSKPDIIQLPTLGPRVMRELVPIFIIPGIVTGNEVREFAQGLLYPTFCAVYPSTPMPIHDTAAELVKKMKEIWKKNVFNIVGVSWGGALAIEVARILAQEKASIHIYFLDGAPSTLQAAVKHLGNSVSDLEANVLTRMLNINDAEISKQIVSAPTWEKKVQIALNNYEKEVESKEELHQALNCLRNQLVELSEYHPTEDLVTGQIHLLRPSGSSKYDNCGLTSYCKQTPQIQLIPGDHLSMVKSKDTIHYVNQNLSLE